MEDLIHGAPCFPGAFFLPFGCDEGDGKTPSFREGMKSSLIVMY